MVKVLVTPRSFAGYSRAPLERLQAEGIEVLSNPTKGILTQESISELIAEVEGVIVGVDPLNQQVLSQAKKLVAIAKYGVGIDNIDLDYCRKNNIDVTITQHANSDAVADYAFALLLAVARRLVEIDQSCRHNDWSKKTSIDVFGKKLGILGLGNIGRGVARRGKGFNMEIYAYDVFKDEEYIKNNQVNFTSVEEIFTQCDFISIHLPLLESTKHLADEKMLERAKENLVIVNTARGGIIDEDALYNALKNKRIYGAGIDVFEHEPPGESPLLSLDNVIVGAHSAASTIGAVDQMSLMATENIIRSFKNKGIL